MTTTTEWFVALLIDVSLKVILLAALAGIVLRLARVRSSSVRHRVWTTVMLAMLFMPLLVTLTPTVLLPTWAYPELRLGDGRQSVAVHEIAATSSPLLEVDEMPALESVAVPTEADAAPATTVAETSIATPRLATPLANWTNRISALVALCYAVGLVLFGGRLLVGLVAAQRLVRSSKPLKMPSGCVSETASMRVLESPHVRVPIVVGWMRSVIVLPSDWTSWTDGMLAAVLAHEKAHIRRCDPWVTLTAEVNRAIYWFHPLAWFLCRRLTVLAEAACDDAVIESTGDRTGYARHLLDLAGRLTKRRHRLLPLGVAMAVRPAVEHRIEAILDERRPLARHVGRLATLILLAVVTPTVLLTAGIAADKGQPEITAQSPVTLASTTGSLLLTVLDDNDAPVPGANVKVRIRQVFMGSDTYSHHQTDNAGRLKIQIPETTPHYFSVKVEVSGHAPFLAAWENRESPDPIPAEYTVWLDPGQTIGGTVRTTEGEPIEGVTVQPRFEIKLREERTRRMGAGISIKTDDSGQWTYTSLPADVQQLPIKFEHPGFVSQRIDQSVSQLAMAAGTEPSAVVVLKRGIPFSGQVSGVDGEPVEGATIRYFRQGRFSSDAPTTTTNSAGTFQFTSGEAGSALLMIAAEGYAPAMRSIQIAKELAPVDIQLSRGMPLRVRVVGPDQSPLEDAYVSFWNWDEYGVYGNFPGSCGKTDGDGMWHWSNAPEGVLEFAVACEGFHYVRAAQLRPGEENVVVMSRETKVESRVLKVSGRVIDAETNAPITRFRVTPGFQREAGGRTIWLHDSQSKGRSGAFRREFTHNDLGSEVHTIALLVEADGYKPAVVQQVVAAKSDFKVDVALDKSNAADYRVLTPSGEAAAGATVAVCTPKVGPIIENGTVISNSTCERTNADASGRFSIMPQDGLFALMVLHESGAAYITQQELGKSHSISLKLWARVEGTLRMRGQLAANESIRLDRADSATMNAPKIHYQYNTTTDEKGKFSFEKVVPGSGQVARVVVSQLGGGMSSSTPTIVSDVTFVPGQTTYVELGRTGREIVGNLAFPGSANRGNDWRLAMISLQSRPKDVPAPPTPPIPDEIDPVKDRDAAMAWWEQWQQTEEGKQFQEDMKRYQEAMQGFKPTHYSARVVVDGSFSFEDIPAGDYQFSVQAIARPTGGGVGHGDVIGTLQHTFTVPRPIDESSSDPVDLGELTVKAVEQRTQRP